MDNICALIPARYKSSRLPGKPLLQINGKTIIQRTYEQTIKSKLINKVIVVTDDDRIVDEVNSFNGFVIKMDELCMNGTERICKILDQIPIKYNIIVNVQGDEPFIDPKNIDLTIEKYLENIDDKKMVCATIHTQIDNNEDLFNRSIGKMALDKFNNVLYCSRSMIPHTKTGEPNKNFKYLAHIGIFVFRRSFLPLLLEHEDTPLQLSEDIEWLKIIEMGYRIKSYEIFNGYEMGVNTKEDYEYLVRKYENNIN